MAKKKCFLVLFLIASCTGIAQKNKYNVSRLTQPIQTNGAWNKVPWTNIPALDIDKRVGYKVGYKPAVKAKVGYTQKSVYVIFKVKAKYVRCKWDVYQDPVYQDSCVEFFFTPSSDPSKGYFNLEINCRGTALFKFHKTTKQKVISIPKSKFSKINISHSLSRTSSELKDLAIWTVEYSIPIKLLSQYTQVEHPASGVEWRANFYSTMVKSTHPYWLSWSPVEVAEPDFHRPEYFGVLKF